MNRLLRWLGRSPGAAPAADAAASQRWVVLDVETTGLDPRRDQLLAIAAVAMRIDWRTGRLSLHPGDSINVTIRPDQVSDKRNVLIHGIGVHRQRQAMEPAAALQAFLSWAADAPLLAYHASFDRELIERYAALHVPGPASRSWLDIAHLCTVAFPDVKARALDDWLSHFDIQCLMRHEAAADVMAECELLQRIWPRVRREAGSWRELTRYAARHTWLGPR